MTRSWRWPELSDYRFAYYNFEWLLCSALTFGFDACRLQNGIAKIPVHVGIWRTAGRVFSPESHETARLMGYAPA